LKKIELSCVPTCIYLEETLSEGLIGSLDGGIVYANFTDEVSSKLVGAPSFTNPIIRAKYINDTTVATIHSSGGFKLWNALNGEELADFTFDKIACQDLLYLPTRNELLAFYDDNSIKSIDMGDFGRLFHYLVDSPMINTDAESRFICDSACAIENNRVYIFAATNKGELFMSDINDTEEITLTEVFIF